MGTCNNKWALGQDNTVCCSGSTVWVETQKILCKQYVGSIKMAVHSEFASKAVSYQCYKNKLKKEVNLSNMMSTAFILSNGGDHRGLVNISNFSMHEQILQQQSYA